MLFLFYFFLFIFFLFAVFFIFYQVYTTVFQPGAVYYPTTNQTVDQMLKLSKITSKDILIDLGSGDGRILIAAANLGATAIGYEINPFLVRQSRRLIRQNNLEKLATVHWKSFWKTDFSQATVVYVYLFPHLMNQLQQLLEKKIKHPIRLIVNNYPFSKLTPVKHLKKIYLYNFPNLTFPNKSAI